jgi:RimJ/RimL family protein N-acetyltransferase
MEVITSSDVRLEPVGAKHIKATFAWVSNPELQQMFLLRRDISWAGHLDYFNKILKSSTQLVYAILYQGVHVGNCGFKHLNAGDDGAELWIYIGSSQMRGKGIGKSAINLLLKEGAGRLGLKRVQLHVAESNEQARSLYLSLGFVDSVECDADWQHHSVRVLKMVWRDCQV